MAKESVPMCVLTLPLIVRPYEADIIEKRFEICRSMYNAMLGEKLRELRKMEREPAYADAKRKIFEAFKDVKSEAERKRARSLPEVKQAYEVMNEMRLNYGFSEFDFIGYVAKYQHHFSDNISSMMANITVARPMWRAFDKYFFGDGKKVSFKRFGDLSVIKSSAKTGIRVVSENGKTLSRCSDAEKFFIAFGNAHGSKRGQLRLRVKQEGLTLYDKEMLEHEVKQIAIQRKVEHGVNHYYVQLIMVGSPAIKYTENGELKHPIKDGKIALFVRSNAIFYKAESDDKVTEVFPSKNIAIYDDRIAKLQVELDRIRRRDNPDNYDADGIVKCGYIVNGQRMPLRWTTTKKYLNIKTEIAELHRLSRVERELFQRKLVYEILAKGTDVRVNKFDFKKAMERKKEDSLTTAGTPASKAKAGRFVRVNAVSTFLTMLDQKLVSIGCNKIERVELSKTPEFDEKKKNAEHWLDYLLAL